MKNKINNGIVMFHSLPKHYSVEVCDFNSTIEEYKLVTKAYFHNFYTKQDNHYGFLYTYKDSDIKKKTFELKIYEIQQ